MDRGCGKLCIEVIMIDYESVFVNTNDVAFPDTEAINSSGGGGLDGTEFIKEFVNDIWGFNQALMDYAGLAPNGFDEAAGASQRIEALIKGMGIGPGIGVTWWIDDDPAIAGYRVLLLEGQGILRSNYQDLDNKVYVGDGANGTAAEFYHADDAAGTIRNIAGIYLILPDSRGQFLRGLDTSGSVDPDGVGRTLGDEQIFKLYDHQNVNVWGEPGDDGDLGSFPWNPTFPLTAYPVCTRIPYSPGDEALFGDQYNPGTNTGSRVLNARNLDGTVTNISSDECRPKNISCRFGITY